MASTRLNSQHYIWTQELGFNLHPSIPLPQKQLDARIADVATGTGVWLLEIAREYPKIQCVGLDISLTQCPPEQWLPQNVTLQQWDMFQDPPPHLFGTFDIVHVRLVLLVIDKDPLPTIRNLTKLLKPGGWIQWDEIDVFDTTIIAASSSSRLTRSRSLTEG